jgi:multidrug resistance efflux pump
VKGPRRRASAENNRRQIRPDSLSLELKRDLHLKIQTPNQSHYRTKAVSGHALARLVAARWNLEQTTVRAPGVGFVTSVILRTGARITEDSSQVMAFVDESEQMVGAQIKQNHIRKIEVGQPAEVIFKLRPGEIFEARFKQISLAGASWMLSPDEFELELPMIQPEPFWVELELTDQSVSLPPARSAPSPFIPPETPLRLLFEK